VQLWEPRVPTFETLYKALAFANTKAESASPPRGTRSGRAGVSCSARATRRAPWPLAAQGRASSASTASSDARIIPSIEGRHGRVLPVGLLCDPFEKRACIFGRVAFIKNDCVDAPVLQDGLFDWVRPVHQNE
jgi:hypothetical protein